MRILLLLFLLLAFGCHAQSDTMCQPYAPILCLTKGENFTLQCDSAFLISPLRYRLYEQAKKMLLKSPSLADDTYLQELRLRVQRCEALQQQMAVKTDSTLQQALINLHSASDSLTMAQQRLSFAQASLTQAQDDLDNARQSLAQAQKASRRNRIVWGTGGVVLGVIMGGLLL